jgi:hypothetical protein
MGAHKVNIGSQSDGTEKIFNSKNDAILFFKNMLHRYQDNQEVDEADSQLLIALLERHPEAQQKIGCGIKRFCRKRTTEGTSCFWLERLDGSSTDFSFRLCVAGKGKTLYQEFAEACRSAVQPALNSAKQEHFAKNGNAQGKVQCEITGEWIASYESHVDHKKPMTFQVIVATFVSAHDIQITRELLSEPRDAQFTTTFVDTNVQEKFREYHHKLASLRVIKIKHNLSLGGSERIIKPKRPVVL